MDPDLVQSTRDGFTFYQRMGKIRLQCCEVGSGGLPLQVVYPCYAFGSGDDSSFHQSLLVLVYAIHYGMVDFIDLPVFKLNSRVTVSRRMLGNDQATGSFLVQSMTHLGIGGVQFCQIKNVLGFMPIVQGG